jgi:hypothetical protein
MTEAARVEARSRAQEMSLAALCRQRRRLQYAVRRAAERAAELMPEPQREVGTQL